MMRPVLLLVSASLWLWGCARGDSDVVDTKLPPGSGQPLNPGGKPRTPDEAKMADAQNRGGQMAASGISQQMKEMSEARARAGGQ